MKNKVEHKFIYDGTTYIVKSEIEATNPSVGETITKTKSMVYMGERFILKLNGLHSLRNGVHNHTGECYFFTILSDGCFSLYIPRICEQIKRKYDSGVFIDETIEEANRMNKDFNFCVFLEDLLACCNDDEINKINGGLYRNLKKTLNEFLGDLA
jgi:hypothetical protein